MACQKRRPFISREPQVIWQSVLEPALLNVLLVRPDKMSAWSLYSYSQHLRAWAIALGSIGM